MKPYSAIASALLLAACTGVCLAEDWPKGMSFIGLKDGKWRLYITDAGGLPASIPTTMEPRAAAVDRVHRRATYVGAEGGVHEVSLSDGSDRVLLLANKERAYTQPAYSGDGRRLFLVEMKGGASDDTEIVEFVTETRSTKPITMQPGAQFEPKALGTTALLYASVSCTRGCGRIIQEIWRKDLNTGDAVQLTLGNTISRQAVVSPDGRWIYVSSDQAGSYHIWRLPAGGGPLEQVTRGNFADVSPAPMADGTLYFVRRGPIGVMLVRRDAGGRETEVPMPAEVEDMRDLEVAP